MAEVPTKRIPALNRQQVEANGTQTYDQSLRDVVALATLPAVWHGAEPRRIAESLAASLFTTINPEFVYVCLDDGPGKPRIAVAQTGRHQTNLALANNLDSVLLDWVREHDPDELLLLPNPAEATPLRVVVRPLGFHAELGVIAAGFSGSDSPTASDHLLLNVGASQAASAIQNAQLLRSLRESEERFRMLADNISQLAWTCDVLGHVTWYNQRWLDYTGMTFEEMRGWNWKKVLRPDYVERVFARVERSAETGEPWEDTFPLRGHDGNYRWFLSRAVQIRDKQDNVVCWFGTNTDIEDLRQAREAAENANRVKDEFLATVSHELRTPLNAILGWSHMLMRGNLNEETVARGLEIIARNAMAQNQLISDLLDVSRIVSGQLRFESGVVELIPVIEAAVETVRPAANAKGVELRLNLDPVGGMVSGDSVRLQQVVWNLLTNAVKFTSSEGFVEVSLKLQDASVAIVVSDNGEGINAEVLPHIFDRFRQAESTTKRQHGGLGLGLAITRHLVEAHGGTIRAASSGSGKGATFTVTFPVIGLTKEESVSGRLDAGDESLDHPPATILRGLRVLVVDDEEDARELLIMLLTQSGATVNAAPTVRAALEILDQWKPDVLVSDIGMPGEDGYDLIRTVRMLKPEKGGAIPALAVTGYASTEHATRALAAGYQKHMAKPVSPTELVSKIASLVSFPQITQSD